MTGFNQTLAANLDNLDQQHDAITAERLSLLDKDILAKRWLILITLFFFAFICSTQATAEILTGRVIGVADGDTITVLDATNTKFNVRLSGIDAPEKAQPFGNVSKKSLSNLVYDKQVDVDWMKRDQYQRIVGKVLLNGEDINLKQIRLGMAWFFVRYQKEQPAQDRRDYANAQGDAEANQIGL